MAVFLVVCSINFKRGELFSALRRHAFRCRFLLRCHQLQLQFAKLQVGAQTEQRRRALHERRVGGERHVARLDELHYFVFLAVILELEVLRVEVESSVGVVVEVHVHLVAHASVDVEVYLLVEVHGRCLAVAHGQRRVVDVLHRCAELQFGSSLRLYPHAAGAEYLFGRAEVEVHVREVELFLSLCLVYFVVLVAEILLHGLALAPLSVLLGSHHYGGVYVGVAYFRPHDIAVERVVVFHVLLQVVRPPQVGCALVEVVEGHGHGALYLPARMQQRVGYGVVVGQQRLCRYGHRVTRSRRRGVAGACRCAGSTALTLCAACPVVLRIRQRERITGHGGGNEQHDSEAHVPQQGCGAAQQECCYVVFIQWVHQWFVAFGRHAVPWFRRLPVHFP